MRRYLSILSLLSLLCINTYAELSGIEQLFYEKYDIIDITCHNEEQMLPTRNMNCVSLSYRGKEYAPLFIPSETDSILNVRVNLIFIQKDDGTGNFQETNYEHQVLFDDVMSDLNRIISSLVLPSGTDCYTGTDADMVHDMRIRFVDHRYYIRNSSLWDNNMHFSSTNLCPSSYNWYLLAIDDSLNNVLEDSLKGINIYFTEDATFYHRCWEVQNLNDTSDVDPNAGGACSEWPSYQDLFRSSRLHMPCQYAKYWWMKNIVPQLAQFNYPSWEDQVRYWFVNTIARGLAHELGHSFYLYHPANETSSSTFYPSSSCYATIMNPAGSSPRNFLPPPEIGRMYIHTMTTNMQQFVPENAYLGTKYITTTTSLPRMRLYHSLEVGNSGNITMTCNMTFSSQCKIRVTNGGVLSVSGAELQAIQNRWGGIIVESGGQLILSDVHISDYNIVIHSGGNVIIKDDLTISGDHFIQIEDGAYLCIDQNATITLEDEFSTIIIAPNAILGCSTCNDSCITSHDDLTSIGSGQIVTHQGTEYIQNVTIMSDYMATGDSVIAGYNVTNTRPEGSVVVENGGNLRIKATQTLFTKDVKVKLGGTLIISQ